jgi:hypothetical protein
MRQKQGTDILEIGVLRERESIEIMERETGIEPATSSLGSWRSTAELLPLTATTNPQNRRSCATNLEQNPPRMRSRKVTQIIILRELICKECSPRASAGVNC